MKLQASRNHPCKWFWSLDFKKRGPISNAPLEFFLISMRQRIKINRIQNFVNQFWDLFYLTYYYMICYSKRITQSLLAMHMETHLSLQVRTQMLLNPYYNMLWKIFCTGPIKVKQKTNLGKCQFICSSKMIIMQKNKHFATVLVKSFLGEFLHSKLTFQLHISSI